MTYVADSFDTLPRLPAWVTSARAETPEDVAFLSGAALSHLHLVLNREEVPQALLRARLALRAAEVCVTLSGRPERASDLRDAVAFLQPGDSPGPAGDVYRSWQHVIERPVSIKALHRALPYIERQQAAVWLDAGRGGPAMRTTSVLEAVIADRPRDYGAALILADAALAQALGWTHMLPLLSLGLKRADLRLGGDELCTTAHRAIVKGTRQAMQDATDLSRRAAKLREVAPKLRAKGAEDAVAQFLSCDALPSMSLTSLRSDRAARRFCDRLVDLGAVRELTARDTFRLYGL